MGNIFSSANRMFNNVTGGLLRTFGGSGISAKKIPGYMGIGGIRYRGGGGNAMPTQAASDPYSEMYSQMAEAMSAQAEAQARYMAQMQALNQAQLEMQQEAAKAANVESSKNPSDFTGANAADVARKQMLRRGLMSTYTRYDSGAQPSAKSAKLGG